MQCQTDHFTDLAQITMSLQLYYNELKFEKEITVVSKFKLVCIYFPFCWSLFEYCFPAKHDQSKKTKENKYKKGVKISITLGGVYFPQIGIENILKCSEK